MRCFCYFVEPASYTIDLAKNIHDKNQIDYCFIYSDTLAKSEVETEKVFLDNMPLFSKFRFLSSVLADNDLIIVNGYNNYVFIITFMMNIFSLRKKFIAIESDTQLLIPNNLLKRLLKWLYLSIVFRNRYILGFSGGNKSHKDLFRYYGMKENRIFLMPMMVDNSKFRQKKKRFPEIFTFLYVGRLVAHKNVEGLIRQFNRFFINKNAVLKIIGSGPEESYLKRNYMSNKVLFLGPLFNKDLISQFKGASCFVLPSSFEPWGLVVNEALSAGLPVIITKEVGAGYDLIRNKQSGIIASNMDSFGFSMLELYDDVDLLVDFSSNASHVMLNYWNYDLYDKCLSNVFKKVKQWS